ncbi:MAG: methyltransferase domain-containing protein [Acidobacteriota bacterium]|nr:methyltransferase domain-containing protein [Acidobacteriota bacterium]
MRRDVYTHGHQRSVVGQHARRTAETCAQFLLPRLQASMRVLDVGCGPGTITAGLANRVPDGKVIGVDVSSEVLAGARDHCAAAALSNVTFEEASVYGLRFDEATFDVAYAHQVLQHLADPVAALAEMRRVLRPGGLVAVRDGDYYTMCCSPESEAIDRWRDVYRKVSRHNGAEPDAGRYLLKWLGDAGFGSIEMTASCGVLADEESRRNWGESWAERCLSSSFGQQAVEYGYATASEMESIAEGWRSWSREPEGYFHFIHGEGIAVK